MKKCLKCNNKYYAKGYCSKHYQRLLRYNDPNKTKYIRNNNNKCKEKSCVNINITMGYCKIHYNNNRLYGHPLGKFKGNSQCRYKDCIKKLKQTNYCQNHTRKLRIIKERVRLMKLLGGVLCNRCKINDYRCLQFDHINGGGTKDKKNHNGHLHIKYLNNPNLAKKILQVLCANCNWIKRWTFLEF